MSWIENPQKYSFSNKLPWLTELNASLKSKYIVAISHINLIGNFRFNETISCSKTLDIVGNEVESCKDDGDDTRHLCNNKWGYRSVVSPTEIT